MPRIWEKYSRVSMTLGFMGEVRRCNTIYSEAELERLSVP
jgi:hypothetical protein